MSCVEKFLKFSKVVFKLPYNLKNSRKNVLIYAKQLADKMENDYNNLVNKASNYL
ncbi:hypothetical protein HMPREF9352_2121 [Streptococcus gallolyticus subsp. gallolyticus TX20005]|nr:hypothetical protein HMPREF9352_2121 [Streptococcus gallolyticus subsp. gallolyticus TX20005]